MRFWIPSLGFVTNVKIETIKQLKIPNSNDFGECWFRGSGYVIRVKTLKF